MPTLTAFERSPDQGRGLARDMRVRWALEEVGRPYDVQLVSFRDLKGPEHRARNPFGQIPTYQDNGLTLFESGGILAHLAEQHPQLLPEHGDQRARAISWMFAALNTVEPPIFEYSLARILERDHPGFAQRAQGLISQIEARLSALSDYLDDADWLVDRFSVADILMVTVMMRAEAVGVLDAFPNLQSYLARARTRPAFQRAFAAQRAAFLASETTADA